MKPFLLLSFILTWFCCSAQTVYFNPGISYSYLDWKIGQSEDNMLITYQAPKLSYGMIVGVEYFQQKHFSVSSDISLYNSGGKLTDEEKDPRFHRQPFTATAISNTYVSLGSTLNFNPIHKKIILQLQVGPRIDYLLANAKSDVFDYLDSRNSLRRINYGFTSGLGVYYNLENMRFGINARYLGRSRMAQDLAPEYTGGTHHLGIEGREKIFLFGASVGYQLKKK